MRILCSFKTAPVIVRMTVMMIVYYPQSLRDVEDLLHERGMDAAAETVQVWWSRVGTISRLRKGGTGFSRCEPFSLNGAGNAQPEECQGRALTETILVCLKASRRQSDADQSQFGNPHPILQREKCF